MISFQHVSYTYPACRIPCMHDINLEIPDGRTVLLCGSSGSGKSTIIRLINGLLVNEEKGRLEGKIEINGTDIANLETWQLARIIGTVFQNPKSQFFNLDTTDEILFGLESAGASHQEMESALQKTVHNLNISSLLNRNIFHLSGGEKQQIAFASIYAMNPDIYLLDEPSSNLDEESILKLRENILKVKKLGKTVVIAEHRLWYIADLIDEAVLIQDGRIYKKMNRNLFLSLNDTERKSYGLRSIYHVPVPSSKQRAVSSSPSTDGLSIRGLTACYERQIVWKNLSFDAEPESIIAITGRNGAGKSTLAKILCGLKKPKKGCIFFQGKKCSAKQLSKLCFLVMQDVNAQLFGDSVLEEVMLDEENSKENRKKAEGCLERCGLLPFRDRHPMTLSGGQKQRLAIADALTSEKKIILFDEPTSGLDYSHMIDFVQVLKELSASGHIILVITHDGEFIRESGAAVLSLNSISNT